MKSRARAAAGRLRRIARRLRRVRTPRALVLMYHRVATLSSDPQLLAVTPEHFEQHLQVIKKQARPIPLAACASALLEGSLPNRSVVITFDDGYLDNVHNALPLLERYEVPATLFVTSGHVGSPREFWWDELDRLVLAPGRLPDRLYIGNNGNRYERDLTGEALFTEEDSRRYRFWHVEQPHDPHPRHRLYRDLYQWLYGMEYDERDRTLQDLFTWAGLDSTARAINRAVTATEVRQLNRSGFMEIGAHTKSHPDLSALDRDTQATEILNGKEWLESTLQRPVFTFSYPHGRYDQDTVSIVQEAGFACACTTLPEQVWPYSNPYELPRMMVLNWDGPTFARQLEDWFRD